MMLADFDATIGLILRTEEDPTHFPELQSSAIADFTKSKGMEIKTFSNEYFPHVWTLRKKYRQPTDIKTCLSKFLENIPDCQQFIHQLKQRGECVVRISVVSTLGQFGFALSTGDIAALNQLDLPLEITVFSYGDCIDSEN